MKKIALFTIVLIASVCARAQRYVMLWHDGEIVSSMLITDVDSITFGEMVTPVQQVRKNRYGYNQLDEEEQKVYDYIVDKLMHFEDNADVYNDVQHRVYMDFNEVDYQMSIQTLMSFLDLIQNDVPETYHLASYIPRSAGNNVYYARVKKSITPDAYAQVMSDIDSIVEELLADLRPSMSDFEKVKMIHDRYIYYSDYGGMTDANGGNVYGGFINKKAVCEGLSRSFLLLCQRAGINCIYVGGSMMTNSTEGTWGNHAWNFVEVDGNWYMVDITADGGFPGYCGYAGFLRGQESFDKLYRMTTTAGDNPNSNYRSMPTLSETDYQWE